jgi:hypothetical protein
MQSNQYKILVVLGILLAISMLIAWFLFGQLSSTNTAKPSGSTNTTSGGTAFGSPPNTPTGTHAPGSSTVVQTRDFAAAYASLFQNINAHALTFGAVDASHDTQGIYALYRSDVSIAQRYASAGESLSVEVAWQDLNYDGTAEALVYENLPGFCGSGGCPFEVYQKNGGVWRKILSTTALRDAVGISTQLTGAFADMYLSVAGVPASELHVVRYAWDGAAYQRKNTVAAWNGAAFAILEKMH